MPKPFFPDAVVLAWAFYVVLVSITLIATYTDLRYLQIPKWLTLPTVALGVLVNIILGALTDGPRGPFLIGGNGGFLGALDGLLLSLCGFVTGFGLFLLMFVLRTCRGGDVKLFAGVGAWVGPMLCLYLLAGTIIAVVLMSMVRLVWKFATHGFGKTFRDYTLRGAPEKKKGQKANEPKTTRRRLTAYSPAVAMSAAFLLLWFFGPDLHLRAPQAEKSAAAQMAQR
jgi:Flp pilus assembly protein protease CpaA